MLYLPNELWIKIFGYLELKDYAKTLISSTKFYNLAINLHEKMRHKYILNYSTKVLNNIYLLLYFDNLTIDISLPKETLFINLLFKLIKNNIDKSWFHTMNPRFIAFLLKEWDSTLEDDRIKHMVCRYRDPENDWSKNFDNLNFFKTSLISNIIDTDKLLFNEFKNLICY
jgi:hypothetical protein